MRTSPRRLSILAYVACHCREGCLQRFPLILSRLRHEFREKTETFGILGYDRKGEVMSHEER